MKICLIQHWKELNKETEEKYEEKLKKTMENLSKEHKISLGKDYQNNYF